MKYRVTKKQMRETNPIAIGYCAAQTLLHYHEPEAYSCGVYGWSCDYYKLWYTTPDDNQRYVYISTGYSPVGKRASYKVTDEYEKKAQDVLYNDNGLSYAERRQMLDALMNEWLNAITE